MSQGRERHRARKILMIVQVGLALVLLICSGLMIRAFRELMHVSPGFVAPESVEQFRFYIPETQIPDSQPERVVRMDDAILNKIAAILGVTSVSFSSEVPMDGYDSNDILYAQDHILGEGSCRPFAASNSSPPDSFPRLALGWSPATI